MNSKDRLRIIKLVREDFESRRESAKQVVNRDNIEASAEAAAELMLVQYKLDRKVKELDGLKAKVLLIERELSTEASKLVPAKTGKRHRHSDCECHEYYMDVLADFCREKIFNETNKTLSLLSEQERKLVLAIETASSQDEVVKLLKAAKVLV